MSKVIRKSEKEWSDEIEEVLKEIEPTHLTKKEFDSIGKILDDMHDMLVVLS